MTSNVRMLKALADPVRLRILDFLQDPPPGACSPERICAFDLEKHVGLRQPTVSHHMKILAGAGLVSATKHGRWVYYEISSVAFRRLVRLLTRYQTARSSPPVLGRLREAGQGEP
jgi:ArsR family transcriptional regulator